MQPRPRSRGLYLRSTTYYSNFNMNVEQTPLTDHLEAQAALYHGYRAGGGASPLIKACLKLDLSKVKPTEDLGSSTEAPKPVSRVTCTGSGVPLLKKTIADHAKDFVKKQELRESG